MTESENGEPENSRAREARAQCMPSSRPRLVLDTGNQLQTKIYVTGRFLIKINGNFSIREISPRLLIDYTHMKNITD